MSIFYCFFSFFVEFIINVHCHFLFVFPVFTLDTNAPTRKIPIQNPRSFLLQSSRTFPTKRTFKATARIFVLTEDTRKEIMKESAVLRRRAWRFTIKSLITFCFNCKLKKNIINYEWFSHGKWKCRLFPRWVWYASCGCNYGRAIFKWVDLHLRFLVKRGLFRKTLFLFDFFFPEKLSF